MNHETDQTESFLSWQGQVTGPHSLREIRSLLKLGKIHSLYKIQVEGEWNLLRDYLTELDQKARNTEEKQTGRIGAHSLKPADQSAMPKAILVSDRDFHDDASETAPTNHTTVNNKGEGEESTGIAITAFILSLMFFIPFLNGITWLLALIFGHLALSQASEGSRSKAPTLAWVGLWLSYVEVSFFLLGIAWFMALESRNMSLAYFVLHGQMLGNALGALIGAGVLMMAVKLVSGTLIRFPACFVGALLPSAVGAFGSLVVQTSMTGGELTSTRGLAMLGLVNLILFVGQMFFWARFIRLPNEEELGLSRAALASLLYTFIFVFIGIGYIALFATLAS